MALATCPECRGQVSDRAPSCPHCGCPFAPLAAPAAEAEYVPDHVGFVPYQSTPRPSRSRRGPRVQTIEQTGKGWKAAMLIGALCLVAGIGLTFIASQLKRNDADLVRAVGIGFIVVGSLVYVWARVGAWWEHG